MKGGPAIKRIFYEIKLKRKLYLYAAQNIVTKGKNQKWAMLKIEYLVDIIPRHLQYVSRMHILKA